MSERSKAERLQLIPSHAIRCNGCKQWLGRLPQWMNAELGNGHQCEKCGCTSIVVSEGRPFGPRYRHWQSLVDEFADYEHLNMLDDPWFEGLVYSAT